METKRLHRWPIFVLVLVVLGVLASADSHPLSADDGWRRTAQGWEHVSTWQFPQRTPSLVYRPPQVVHPLFLVAFQGMLSVLALACVNSQHLRKQKPPPPHSRGFAGNSLTRLRKIFPSLYESSRSVALVLPERNSERNESCD